MTIRDIDQRRDRDDHLRRLQWIGGARLRLGDRQPEFGHEERRAEGRTHHRYESGCWDRPQPPVTGSPRETARIDSRGL
ncbi:hypothetical protein [Natronorubrum aibiense]|uniref:Uncharacterized protein n=1 Tax=Natronorubrum aibiense TaxID=348826 RepID=A0A5P9P3I5_9EURY|nr:hypothetical protein [Natronorubrum aibiense]QFU82698.1 hypothetical protein GCU68_09260 [Natronorubrum aibiense]